MSPKRASVVGERGEINEKNENLFFLPQSALAPNLYEFLDEFLPAAVIESNDEAGVEVISILSDAWTVHIYDQDPPFFDLGRCESPVWLACIIKDASLVNRLAVDVIIGPDELWVERELTIIYVIAQPSVIAVDFLRLREELMLHLLGADRRKVSVILVPNTGKFQSVVAAGIYSVQRSVDCIDLVLPIDFSDVLGIFGGRVGLLSAYHLDGYSINLGKLFSYEYEMTEGLAMRLGTDFIFHDEWQEEIGEICEALFPNGVYGKFAQSYKSDYKFGFDVIVSQFAT